MAGFPHGHSEGEWPQPKVSEGDCHVAQAVDDLRGGLPGPAPQVRRRLSGVDQATRVAHVLGSIVEYRLSGGEAAIAGDVPSRGVVLVAHGGHLRAGVALGERSLLGSGYDVLVPSRPGYGRTGVSAGPDPDRFADTVAALCAELGITSVRTVVGVSAGGPTAVALAERHPALVRSLLLVSARSTLPFPTGAARLAARVAFHPRTESWTWAATAGLLRRRPGAGLGVMMGSLSTLPARTVLADLSAAERRELSGVFSAMRSGTGFALDVRHRPGPASGRRVRQPTLVVASRRDGQVGWVHAEDLHRRIAGSTLWESPSSSHLVWFGSGAAATERRILEFLAEFGESHPFGPMAVPV